MRKWLRITIFVGLGVLLVVAAGLFVVWRALQHVPEFYREALAVTPALEEQATDEKGPQATAPASDEEREDRWNALFARATALASERDAPAVAPASEEEASDEKSPQATAPPSDEEQKDRWKAMFARATALASDADAPAGTPAFKEETPDEKSPQATALASDPDAPAGPPALKEETPDEKSPQATVPASDPDAPAGTPALKEETPDEKSLQATAPASDRGQQGRWNALFTAKDINDWLAVDLGKNLSNLVHGALSDPRVAIEEDRLMVGCRLRRGDVNTVLSLSGDAYLVGPNTVAVRIRRAQAGALTLPMGRVQRRISEAALRSGLTIQWRQINRLPVALISFPLPRSEADRLVRIDTLRFGEGEIYLSGSTAQP